VTQLCRCSKNSRTASISIQSITSIQKKKKKKKKKKKRGGGGGGGGGSLPAVGLIFSPKGKPKEKKKKIDSLLSELIDQTMAERNGKPGQAKYNEPHIIHHLNLQQIMR
jgi:hypothetical protein